MSDAGVQIVRIATTPPEGFETLRRAAADEGYGFLDRLAEEIGRGDYAGDAELPCSSQPLPVGNWQASAR